MTREGPFSSRARWFVVWVFTCAAMVLASPAQAALITVNSRSDTALNGDMLCTLREAAFSADFNSSSGGDCTAGDASSLDTIQLGANTYDTSVGLHFMNTSDTGGVKIVGAGI